MQREFFLITERIGFSKWRKDDTTLAELLWGDKAVTKYICATAKFTKEDIANRLKTETANDENYHIQYWPIFDKVTDELIGCCGLRPHSENTYEIGFHLRHKYWNKGYATEAAQAVINYAFTVLCADALFAGHNPNNRASARVLQKLDFRYTGDEFYPPTGLYHPSYELKNPTM